MSVPKFRGSSISMRKEQRYFYKELEASLNKCEYLDVDGNLSYVFIYLHKKLSKWNEHGLESLSELLIYISEIYAHEEKLSYCCLCYAYDCLLGLKKYEEYLEKTEPKIIYGASTHISDRRLNLQKQLGIEENPVDILLLAGGRRTDFIINNQAIYKDKIREEFQRFSSENGGWPHIFEHDKQRKRDFYYHTLFQGLIHPVAAPKLEIELYTYFYKDKHHELVNNLAKKSENEARKEIGFPEIGKGWVSETELFKRLEREFTQTTVIHHGQPQWLGRQHFDIWFPNWKVAVEYHGRQHFEPVEFFGGQEAYDKTVERDLKKIEVSKRNGVKLIVVTETYCINELVGQIYAVARKRKALLSNA